MVRHRGYATEEGTRSFADGAKRERRLPVEHFRRGPDGLTLSSLGLGTYLGQPDTATDLLVEDAVRIALSSGRVNVIDTAINYRYQRAERSIGRALDALLEGRRLRRAEVFVASKVGYLAPDGESNVSPAEWVRRELIEPGTLRPEEVVGGSHAMSPAYLEDQVDRSRRNLGLETIDLLYLHNAADAQIPSIGLAAFWERLKLAFGRLEALRARGALRFYGLASWDALRLPPDDPQFLPLEPTVRLAEMVGGPHHGFRFVQFPLNVARPEALLRPNQRVGERTEPLLVAARHLGLAVFTSAPLLQGELARSGPQYGSLSRATSALQWARSAPGNLAPLLGAKQPGHLAEGLSLATLPPWEEDEFASHGPRSD